MMIKPIPALMYTYSNVWHYRYEPFDFHKECKHMRWDRLSILMDRIADEQDQHG